MSRVSPLRISLATTVLMLAAVVLSPAYLHSQTRKKAASPTPAGGFKVGAIHVIGTQRFPEKDVVAATGLTIGQAAVEDDFRRVTQRLGETGAFTDVAYTFQYSGGDAKLEIKVKEAELFVPARFDNFVWLSQDELVAKLHSVLPLFHGELPASGSLPDQVSEELQAMLSERNAPGHVTYVRAGPENAPVEAFVYTVGDTNIRIRNLSFSGAGPQESDALQEAADRLQGEDYSRSTLGALSDQHLLPVFLARGYLQASIGQPQAKVVQQTSEETDVDLSFAVTPGKQYQLSAIEFAGYKAIPAQDLKALIHLKSGKPADAVRLGRDIQAMVKLYATHGYMAAEIHPLPAFDETAGTVSYRLQVTEGDQYHMGELDIRGLDSRATARLQAAWKLKEGDAYDASYLDHYLEETKGLLAGDWDIDTHQTPDAKDKIVDVTLRFSRKS